MKICYIERRSSLIYADNMNTSQGYNLATLLLRLAGGGLMLTHGIPKLQQLLIGDFKFADPLGLGMEISLILTVFAEFLCAVCILIGFKTKWAAIPLLITMLVAAFIVHGADPISRKEMALVYVVIYAAIFFLGAGKFSLDHYIKK